MNKFKKIEDEETAMNEVREEITNVLRSALSGTIPETTMVNLIVDINNVYSRLSNTLLEKSNEQN